MRSKSLALLALVACLSSTPGHAAPRFRHLNMEDGLSNNEVYTLLQDKKGYMWVATGDGLDRYDGYGFRIFRHDPNDPASLSGNYVKSMCEDSAGRLWIAAFPHGVDLYDPATETFKHYRHVAGDPDSLISDAVTFLKKMSDGSILIGTSDAGLDILDPVTEKFRHFPAGSSPAAPVNNRINSIFVDSRGQTWLSTVAGFDHFDPTGKTPIRHFAVGTDARSNSILAITEDARHRLWLATHDGAYVYDPGSSNQPPNIRRGPKDLEGAILIDVFVDSQQNVWFASQTSGLYMLRAGSDQLRHYAQVMGSSDTLESNNTQKIFEDRAGFIWIGTDNGVNIVDPDVVDVFSLKPGDVAGNRNWYSDRVTALLPYAGRLLLGSSGGIYQFDPSSSDDALKDQRNVFLSLDRTRYGPVLDMVELPGHELIMSTASGDLLTVNPQGHILRSWHPGRDLGQPLRQINRILLKDAHEVYLGTFGTGLLDFDLASGKTHRINGATPSELMPTDLVEDVLKVSPAKFWAGTFRGVFLVDMSTGLSALVPMTPGNIEPVVQSLYEDGQRTLWIGTYDGLWRIKLDAEGNPISSAEAVPELRKTQVLSIEQDHLGRLWLATVNSMIRFDPTMKTMLTFGRDQGSPMSEYFSYGHTHTSNGWLWFSGGQGAMGFRPEDLKPNLHAPDVVMNAVTTYREGKPVHVLLPDGKPLQLSYQDAISIFDLAAMDFGAPQANLYSYRLLGFQSQWTPPSPSHLITFTNLNPGRYRFEVRAANSWGTWSTTPAALDIVVLPPWWRTWWAYTLYILFIIGSSIAYINSLKRKLKREESISASLREANEIKSNFVEKLEVQVKEATQELRETLQGVNLKNAELEVAQKRATEGEQIKSQFLANMSHELRTPLTGVLGYTKLLTSTPLSSEQKDYVGTIRQSSETLLAIINDTLDLSRLEAGKLLIDEVDFDLLEVIESTLELLAPTAYQKRLELVRVVPPEVPLQLRGDPLRLRQVLTNLLSNAIKFTESGSVSIEVHAAAHEERDVGLVFTVSDTGIGIPEGEVGQLFTAYARGRISTRHHVEGTGLGLAICKKLLDLMGGEIRVTSRVGSGTRFDFQLRFRLQKNVAPRPQLPSRLRVLLYDAHPLSNQAWRACLARMGAEVQVAADLEAAATLQADAALMSLSERDLSHLQDLQRKLPPAMPPTLVLAPRIERQALRHLSETLYHRVLSKSAREKTVYLELQSLVQTALKQESDTGAASPRGSASPPPDAPLVLVADDNRINRRLLVTMLNQSGFRTAEAGTGLELLDLAARGPWHAALLDIHMPGLDGIETAVRLRSTYGDAVPPIIAMSADVMPEARGQTEQGIMDDFLMKPFNEQQLVELLRLHIDRHDRRRRSAG
jgi:signal transduction histidine kinase/CheY-like chemotaxis protein